ARGGFRRVVPSPRPLAWVEGPAFRALAESGLLRTVLPVVAGGGGIPVVDRGGGRFEGVEAVIDKDRASAVVAAVLHIDTLALVTDVPAAVVGFRRPWERPLGEVSASELRGLLARGEFGAGSMAPKVEAILDFLAHGGRRGLITDSTHLARGLAGHAGTRVERSG
ncbi:MAG: carbamate kinase, partial [Thermoplasmata archaeon]